LCQQLNTAAVVLSCCVNTGSCQTAAAHPCFSGSSSARAEWQQHCAVQQQQQHCSRGKQRLPPGASGALPELALQHDCGALQSRTPPLACLQSITSQG
jgi:hypothetical protein